MNTRNLKRRGLALALAAVLAPAAGARADDGWNVSVEAGALAENIYPGSERLDVAPVPAVRAACTAGAWTWFVALPYEGVGIVRTDRRTGLTTTLSANFGGMRDPDEYSVVGVPVRHDDETRAYLAGSPEVSTPVRVEARLAYPTALGVVGLAASYHPTRVAYARPDRDDATRNGFLVTFDLQRALVVRPRLLIAGSAGLGVMDRGYAEAWFANVEATAHLAEFAADAGLRDARAALYAEYRVGADVSVSLYAEAMRLLGDAADSPFTTDRHQRTLLLRTTYGF